ncbi:hypothetical protein PAMP_001795 [Pampus punctatissimus]
MITQRLSLTCDRLLSHLQLACCRSHCGIPLHGKEMLIYSNVDKEQESLLLSGHHGEISAMTFGKRSSPVLLCSASADYIIVWDIELCQKRTKEGKVAAGTVIGTLLGEVIHLSFCFSDERVVACSGATAYILNSKRQEVISNLTGHVGPLTSAEFCPWDKDILVTASEDRTFKVFVEVSYVQPTYLNSLASPLLSVFFLEENRHIITGSTDGQVWCFSLPDDHKCHLVTKMDLQKMEKRYQMHQETVSCHADYPNLSITMAGSWSFSDGCNNSMVFLVSSLFTPCVVLLKLSLCDLPRILAGGEIKEQPLVFHSKVKSSGYSSSPRRVMFSPKTTVQKSRSTTKAHKNTGLLLRDYPADSAAPTVPRIHLSIANKPVHCLQYTGDGKQILCGLGDNSVLLYKSSLTGNPAVYTGHDKPVSSVSWSLNRQSWLSASEDQTLRIWTHGSPEPAIIIGDSMFSKPIRSAQFYYLDKFLLLASGHSLYLYLYNVDITHDDIKR